ncbi:transposable element Tcb2 transposase [Trichonephila clavipes]|nr:transposable element Tcb2 transposase [Trichonephila clavipes]
MLGRRMAARPRPPATVRELEIVLLEEWISIPQSLIDNLIASMANRVHESGDPEHVPDMFDRERSGDLAGQERVLTERSLMSAMMIGCDTTPDVDVVGSGSDFLKAPVRVRPPQPSPLKWSKVLGPVDPRDVIYTKTRLKTPSTYQSSIIPPHRKKCMRTASSSAIRAQVATLLGTPVSSRTILKRLAEGHLGSRHPLRGLLLTPTYRSLRLEWCHKRQNWTAAKWNQGLFSDESKFNLSSDDYCVRVRRPRSERLNPAFALQ